MHTVLLVTLVALVGSTAAYDFDFKNVIYPGTQRIVNRQFCDNSAAFALTAGNCERGESESFLERMLGGG